MKNIRSNKSQDGFAQVLALLAGLAFAYFFFMFLFLLFGFSYSANEKKEQREYRATFTDTEWVVKEEYEEAMNKCDRYPDRTYQNFNCNWTEAEWATTPIATKAIVRRLDTLAFIEWENKYSTYTVTDSGSTRKRYPDAKKTPCTFTYLNVTYTCG